MSNIRSTILRGLILASGLFASAASAQAPSSMLLTTETTQPIGHYELCQRLPSECRVLRAKAGAIKLNQASWSRMIDVNAAINSMIKPVTDQEMWGKEEVWSYPSNKGDCEDFVLLRSEERRVGERV